jgi:protein-tyrosine phosphatase
VLSILFVCTGNICRSPLAQGLLESRTRALALPVAVESCGTYARRGSPATSDAVVAAREFGLDLEGHRARPLTEHLVGRADLVLALSREHLEEVLLLVPEAAPKTFTLKELAVLVGALPDASAHTDPNMALDRIAEADRLRAGPGAPLVEDPDVRDPIGRALFMYREVGWDIGVAVDAVLTGLFGERRSAGRAAASGEG